MTADTITAIKKALDVDMNQGVTAVDRLRLLSGGQPDFDPLTVEDAEWIENALKLTLSTLESLQRKNERLQAEIDRKSSMPGDHRYWEGRYRDEAAENDILRAALRFYADPEIYKSHPHGLAFDRRDLSYRAKSALSSTGDTHGN